MQANNTDTYSFSGSKLIWHKVESWLMTVASKSSSSMSDVSNKCANLPVLFMLKLVETKLFWNKTVENLEENATKWHVISMNTRAEMPCCTRMASRVAESDLHVSISKNWVHMHSQQKHVKEGEHCLSFLRGGYKDPLWGRRDFDNVDSGATWLVSPLLAWLVLFALKNMFHTQIACVISRAKALETTRAIRVLNMFLKCAKRTCRPWRVPTIQSHHCPRWRTLTNCVQGSCTDTATSCQGLRFHSARDRCWAADYEWFKSHLTYTLYFKHFSARQEASIEPATKRATTNCLSFHPITSRWDAG